MPQALPRWEMSGNHGPAPFFRARAFPSPFGVAEKLMHAWVAQEDREEGVSGTNLALVRTYSISQRRSWCASTSLQVMLSQALLEEGSLHASSSLQAEPGSHAGFAQTYEGKTQQLKLLSTSALFLLFSRCKELSL